MANLYAKRFQEISDEMEAISATRKQEHSALGTNLDYVETERLNTWIVRTEGLISSACGPNSEYLKHFIKEQEKRAYETGYRRFKRMASVFLAAKADFEGGYLASLRSIVQAEVFTNELEQAQELLSKGYKAPAAVIAGVVLETSLTELCTKAGLVPGKMDRMNADLSKAGAYNLLQQKRITALAQIRNDAAHGKWDQFTDADVKSMIADVERFLADHLN